MVPRRSGTGVFVNEYQLPNVETQDATAFVHQLHQLPLGGHPGRRAGGALEAGNSPQIIFQHYRELVRPKDATSWFSIGPAQDGKIVYIEAAKGAEEPEAKAQEQAAAQVA